MLQTHQLAVPLNQQTTFKDVFNFLEVEPKLTEERGDYCVYTLECTSQDILMAGMLVADEKHFNFLQRAMKQQIQSDNVLKTTS